MDAAGRGARILRLERPARRHASRAQAGTASRFKKAALSSGRRPGLGTAVLGLVLAAGLLIRSFHPRPTALRIRVRHAAVLVAARYLHARIRPVSSSFQHQSVSMVQTGLVLFAVCADRA